MNNVATSTDLPLKQLRALIQDGIDSGPSEPWDVAAVKREMGARCERRSFDLQRSDPTLRTKDWTSGA